MAAIIRNSAEHNIQPAWETLLSSHLPESLEEEHVDVKHETPAVFPKEPLLGGSEESHDGGIQHDLDSLGHRREKDDFSDTSESRQTVIEDKPFPTNISERVAPTVTYAKKERDKYATRAMWSGYILNAAIGLQVLAGALITAIAAAASGKQSSIAVSALGGLTTFLASYLARVRGSGEPELSINRVKDLEQFLRDAESFIMDHGEEYGTRGDKLDERVVGFRRRFELLLGNS